MENLGYIIGYLLTLTVYMVKTILQFIFKLFGVKIFNEEIIKPDPPASFRDRKDSYTKSEEFENSVRKFIFSKGEFKMFKKLIFALISLLINKNLNQTKII